MNVLLLAQMASWGIAQWAIFIVVICGVIGIVFVVTRQMGVTIPPFLIQVLWILLAVIVGVLAIKFIMTML